MLERIAYEDLQVGDVIQPGDEWQSADGRWYPLVLTPTSTQVRDGLRARRPHNIAALQKERDEFQTALIESRLALKCKVAEVMEVCKERDEACRERDSARAEVARLSTEVWARKPLEDRIASLTHELANAAVDGYNLQHERDETRAELQRLQEVVRNLYNEPTARQVQQMLRTWATELDWSVGCFDSAGREQIDTIQKTLVAVIERIEGMINSEGSSDGE